MKKQIRKVLWLLKCVIKEIKPNIIYVRYHKGDSGLFLPYSNGLDIDYRQLHNIVKGYNKWLLDKYTYRGFAEINHTDTVIDCGAFVGGFSIAAAESQAKKIFSIEPSEKNYRCLLLNLSLYKCINFTIPLNIGIGNKEEEMKLNLSKSACDDSFLEPDEQALGETEKVKVLTLANIIENNRIDIDNLYLKVEAEGFEPEIILGLGSYKPRVIVVDVTKEKGGRSPLNQIESILKHKGYVNFKYTNRCLFALKQYS